MLQIAVINESTAIADVPVQEMTPAFSTQWNTDLNAAWGVGAAQFTFSPKSATPGSGAWWVVFLDDSDQADALAYHDLTNEGLPISKVPPGIAIMSKDAFSSLLPVIVSV